MLSEGNILAILFIMVAGALGAPAATSTYHIDFEIRPGNASHTESQAMSSSTSSPPPGEFTANPNIGPGGSVYSDSPHFRLYGVTGPNADLALSVLEASHSCFVDDMGWRSGGLSYHSTNDDGPYTKVNVYANPTLPAAGTMSIDYETGMSWLQVNTDHLQGDEFLAAAVFLHEYGHSLTYAERTWVDQAMTQAWWETLANWFQDLYKTSEICEPARRRHGRSVTETEIDLQKSVSDSYQTIVDGSRENGNFYRAWPFLTYLTYNPDQLAGLGTDTVLEMIRQYVPGSGETPLHTLSHIAVNDTVGEIVGGYWSRMAYIDIGHPTAQAVFLQRRGFLNFANYDASGANTYRVKAARAPRYMGANITPLRTAGVATVTLSISSDGTYTATLAVRNTETGVIRYVAVAGEPVSVDLGGNEEATLVVANTPATLISYNPFELAGSPANVGLTYTVTMTGATF